jgi:transposase
MLEKKIQQSEKSIELIQGKINQLIEADLELQRKKKILASVYGIGERIATELIVSLPELGHCNRRQIAALCGLAPFNNESGNYQGHRCIKGGRARVREALFMAAMVSVRRESFYTSAYNRMVNDLKKAKKVALIMVARKLVCYLNSLMKRAE